MNGWAVMILAGLAGLLYYAWRCLLYSYVDCLWCKGSSKRRPKKRSRVFGRCWWCKGTGYRKRIGRRIFDYWWRRMHDK